MIVLKTFASVKSKFSNKNKTMSDIPINNLGKKCLGFFFLVCHIINIITSDFLQYIKWKIIFLTSQCIHQKTQQNITGRLSFNRLK